MHSSSKRKNKRLFGWTLREIENLSTGVKKYGENWNEILKQYKFHISRNPNSLRKKYKRLGSNNRLNKKLRIRSWSEKEIEYLEEGVSAYGTNWKKILDEFPFNNRTVNALSKKWRYEYRRKQDVEETSEESHDDFDEMLDDEGSSSSNSDDSVSLRTRRSRRRRVLRTRSQCYGNSMFLDDETRISPGSNQGKNENVKKHEAMKDEGESDSSIDDIEEHNRDQNHVDQGAVEEHCDVKMIPVSYSMLLMGSITPFYPSKLYSPKLHQFNKRVQYFLEDENDEIF